MVYGFVELAHFRWDMVRLNHTKSTNTTGWRHLVCMCVFHLVLGWSHSNMLEKGWQQLQQTTGSSTTAVRLDESNRRKVINHGAAWHYPTTDFLREPFLVYFRNAQDLHILSAYSFSFSIQTFKPVPIDSIPFQTWDPWSQKGGFLRWGCASSIIAFPKSIDWVYCNQGWHAGMRHVGMSRTWVICINLWVSREPWTMVYYRHFPRIVGRQWP
jgi:hypothetical protein